MVIEITDASIKEMMTSQNKVSLVDKQKMLNFAEHCMLKLLSVKPEGSLYPEISAVDVHRIKQILKEFV